MKASQLLQSGSRVAFRVSRLTSTLGSTQVNRQSPLSQRSHICQNRSYASFPGTANERLKHMVKEARKDNPILFPVLLVATLAALSVLGLMSYDEYTRVAPEFAAYPDSVEQRLRMALHYTHVRPDPDTATRYFMDAIKGSEMAGMDPYSKEVMGMRVRFAEMLEKFGRVKASIEVLAGIVKDWEQRLEEFDRQIPRVELKIMNEEEAKKQRFRQNLLRSIIQMKVKMSSLYESDYIQDPTSAKQILSDAIGLLVKDTQDPQTRGFNAENGAGLSLGEIASMLSQMGDLYATTGEEANAVQVYMLTLDPLRQSCNGTRSCKEVQVLSNIASTMDLAMKKPGAKINGQPATKESLAAARRSTIKWADQAIATASVVKPEDRDEICELGLLSAQLTKADLLLESGDKEESRKTFASLLPTLRQKGLTSLIQVAEQGIKRAS